MSISSTPVQLAVMGSALLGAGAVTAYSALWLYNRSGLRRYEEPTEDGKGSAVGGSDEALDLLDRAEAGENETPQGSGAPLDGYSEDYGGASMPEGLKTQVGQTGVEVEQPTYEVQQPTIHDEPSRMAPAPEPAYLANTGRRRVQNMALVQPVQRAASPATPATPGDGGEEQSPSTSESGETAETTDARNDGAPYKLEVRTAITSGDGTSDHAKAKWAKDRIMATRKKSNLVGI